MLKSFSIGKYIVRENLSNKILNGFLVFAGIILLSTLLLKELSIYKSDMIIRDSGIFLIEFFVFLVSVLSSSSYLIREHKEKSIYLVLTKPVSRTEYILGNLIGNIFMLMIYISIMTVFLQGILLYTGFSLNSMDLMNILFIFLKLCILSSLGIFFAVISDSYVTANIFTFSVYVLGHFTTDLLILAEKSESIILKTIFNIFYYVLPRYYTLNLRDYLIPMDINYFNLFAYVFAYILIVSMISSLIFEKRKL